MLSWDRAPAATGNVGEILWEAVLEINATTNNASLVTVFRSSGPAGATGATGPIGATGPAGGVGPTGVAGRNADIYMPIFQRNTSPNPSVPATLGTWNGTDYDPPVDWLEQPPISTTSQYVVSQWIRLSGNSPYTITALNVPLLVGLRLPQTPIVPSTSSYVFTYGLATVANAPTGSPINLAAVQLAVGQSHTYTAITMPITTATGVNYYVELPTGIVMTSARDSFQGETINDWTRTGQRWFYAIGYANSQETIVFTIRRDA